MSLEPCLATVQLVKDSICSTLQNTAVPVGARAACIAPQLAIVNQWADQIPLVLENPDAPANVNLVFAIRKDLFVAPQYVHSVLGIPGTDLPPPFASFLAMILKLIGAQKSDKEKPTVKVPSLFFLSSWFVLTWPQPRRTSRFKSKAYVDSDDDIEISLPTVSEARPPASNVPNDQVSLALRL